MSAVVCEEGAVIWSYDLKRETTKLLHSFITNSVLFIEPFFIVFHDFLVFVSKLGRIKSYDMVVR